MSWSNIDQLADPEVAKKQAELRKRNANDIAKAYHRVFTTDDGARISWCS
jgi:hypothetical protein